MLAYYLHNLDPIIFRIYDNVGPRWYGLAYVLAFVSSYFLFVWLAKRGYADLPPQSVGDFITGCALFGVIIGGRLGYVFFYKPEMLREPLSILRVWEGGMSSHGGMLGILLFTLYYAHRHKISWLNLGDNLVVTAPMGLFFGRCANFINGELYGRIANLPWAMQFPKELLDRSAQIGTCSGQRARESIRHSRHRTQLSARCVVSQRSRTRYAPLCRRAIRRNFMRHSLRESCCSRFCGLCGRGHGNPMAF